MKNIIQILFISTFVSLFSCEKDESIIPVEIKSVRVSNLSATSVLFTGELVELGEGVEEYGVEYDDDPDVLIHRRNTPVSKIEKGEYSLIIEDLEPGVTYYFEAYAKSNGEYIRGKQISIATESGNIQLTTNNPVNITIQEAVSGGAIISRGGLEIIEKGICFSIEANPTVVQGKIVNLENEEEFVCQLKWLKPDTRYYIRSYATNKIRTYYGEEVQFSTKQQNTFTDSRDGNIYRWVKLGDQIWMADNLKYMPYVTPVNQYGDDGKLKYYIPEYYGDDVVYAKSLDYYEDYGVYYNFDAALNACPKGWHLPSDDEWEHLAVYLSKQDSSYEKDGDVWNNLGDDLLLSNTYGNNTNKYSFNGIEAGHLEDGYLHITEAVWWTSTKYDDYRVYCRRCWDDFERQRLPEGYYGLNVRCIKD